MEAAARAKPVIVVTGADLAQEALALLQDFEIVYTGREPQEQALAALCRLVQPVAIIVRYGRIGSAVMDQCAGLKVISRHGTGTDVIDLKAAERRGIAVRAAAGANAAAVAEHTWALILACAKSIPRLDARMREGHWDKPVHRSMELQGRTLGLVGMGAIGRRVAAVGLAMGMRVLGHTPSLSGLPAGVEPCAFDGLIAQSDVISLHCPLTHDNRHMISAQVLQRTRPGAVLINTARGPLVDSVALAAALRDGRLRAAGVDNFDVEPPPPGHVLLDAPNLILTPHVGGVSDRAYVGMGMAAARNVLEVLGMQATLQRR